jgi:DNA end-binding protein Ku
VGKFVLWGKENLCLIRTLGDSLALETLYFAEDIRSRSEIDEAVEETEASNAELKMALELVESLVGEFDPTEFENEYRNDLRRMLEAKLAGEEIKQPEPAAPVPVIDLMEALKQSVAQAHKQKTPAKTKRGGPSRKRTAAR